MHALSLARLSYTRHLRFPPASLSISSHASCVFTVREHPVQSDPMHIIDWLSHRSPVRYLFMEVRMDCECSVSQRGGAGGPAFPPLLRALPPPSLQSAWRRRSKERRPIHPLLGSGERTAAFSSSLLRKESLQPGFWNLIYCRTSPACCPPHWHTLPYHTMV